MIVNVYECGREIEKSQIQFANIATIFLIYYSYGDNTIVPPV